MKAVSAFGGLAFVIGTADQGVNDTDSLDYEDAVLDHDIALGLAAEVAMAGVYPARFQRATQGAGQSTGGCSDNVVERRSVILVFTLSRSVVLAHLGVGPKEDRLVVDGQVGPADRSSLAHDPDPRNVCRLVHA